MIDTFPADFNTTTYDLITADGSRWSFGHDDSGHYLFCGNLRQPVIESNGRPTFFAPGYHNINLHGFTIDGVEYILTGVTPNDNWTEPPPAPVVHPAEDAVAAKERVFAAMLLQYAVAFNVDLTALPDINISAMLQAAQAAGATPAEIADASAILMALFNDVVVESGGTPGKAWEGLKERLPGYFQELAQNA